jgi:hypothetical protein
MTYNFVPKKSHEFECTNCEYITDNKKDYNKHIMTRKHKILTGYLQKIPKQTILYNCECGKIYKHRQSLHNHTKICTNNDNNDNNDNNNFYNDDNDVNYNKDDLIQYLINENKEFKGLILEVCKNFQGANMTNCNNINSNINSNNKTFNLQFFLNETCKDAMNITEFIDSMELQLSDFESVGKLGFVDGISCIIIKKLKALDVEKRPIHCSDTKRETMYIKDEDKWEKEDDDLKRLKRVIKGVQDKNIKMIPKWKELYPDCILSNSKHTDKFNNMCFEIMGGDCNANNNNFSHKNEKIIKKIAKEVSIEKYE